MKSARDDSLCKWRRHWPFLFISYSLSTTIPTTTTSSSSSSTLIRLGSSSRAPVQYGKRRRTATSQPAVPTQSDSPLPKCAARDGALLLVDVWSKSVNKKEENKGGKKQEKGEEIYTPDDSNRPSVLPQTKGTRRIVVDMFPYSWFREEDGQVPIKDFKAFSGSRALLMELICCYTRKTFKTDRFWLTSPSPFIIDTFLASFDGKDLKMLMDFLNLTLQLNSSSLSFFSWITLILYLNGFLRDG